MALAGFGFGQTELYSTGFENADGFSSSTTYNNTTESLDGSAGNQWATMEGTPSTTSPLIGSQSMQMRDYTSNDVTPYTYTNFTLDGVTSMTFYAANTSSVNVTVQYSTNGGSNWQGDETFTLSTSSTQFTYDISATGIDDVQFRFNHINTNSVNKARLYIDGIVILGTTAAGTPTISLSETTLSNFYYVEGNGPSSEQSFTVEGSDLTADISIEATANYEISTGTGGSFSATNPIVLAQSEGIVNSTSIYVRLKAGLVVGDYNEIITATSTDATNKTVSCSGSVEAPSTTNLPYNETFDSDLGDCYTYSVSGDTKQWIESSSVASMNGYDSGDIEEDWLILPGIDFNYYTGESLVFDSYMKYGSDDDDNYLKLLYSDNYTGLGDPSSATWTELSYTQPSEEEVFVSSGTVDLSAIDGSSVYIAFKYHYNSGNYRNWKIDNISISGIGSSTWKTDAATTDWHTASNWDNGLVPNVATNVTIPVGATNYPTISAAATCNNLTLESNASGDASLIGQENLTVTGTTTVQRYATAGVWHGFSSPVSGADFNSLYLNGNPDVWGKSYDESDNEYDYASSLSTPLGDMKGWMLWIDGETPQTFDITGNLRSGTIGTADNMTNQAGDASHGYNFVGNPFPSAIDWDAEGWTKTNIGTGFWILNDATNQWMTYNGTEGLNGGSQYISSGQAFFVQVDEAFSTGTLQMTDAVQVHNTVGFFKEQNVISNRIKLKVSDESNYDESIIRLDSQATEDFESNLDMHKMFSYDQDQPQLFSTANNNMSINVLPMETVSVAMDVRGKNGNEMTISLVDVSDFAQVFLSDDLLGTQTNLMESPYVFTYDASETNRFTVYFTVVGIEDNMLENVQVYSYDKKIKIEVPVQMNAKVELVNLMGQKLIETNVHFGTHELNMNQTGYYLVRIIGNNSSVTHKVFIK